MVITLLKLDDFSHTPPAVLRQETRRHTLLIEVR